MKKISNLFITFGVILLIGTAGASDIGNIGLLQIGNQILIALSFIVSGKFVAKVSEFVKSRKRCEKIRTVPYLGSVK